MSEHIQFEITENSYSEYIGERIDKCIGNLLTDTSRSYIQKLLKDGNILVNQKTVKASYKLQSDDVILVALPAAMLPDIEPENIPITILYEDDDLLIVNKPKGMVVHPAPGHYSGTLVNALLYHCQGNLSGINGVMRPGIVHRIDKDTTGSLLVCKNDFTHQQMAQQLKDHSISRKYQAIVYGMVKDETGTVNIPIGRHPQDRKKMSVHAVHGKEAVTHYTVLRRFEKYTHIECRLETGRTHQIRVHMAAMGYPVLGDQVYSNRPCPFSLTGQTLHAEELSFEHPRTGEYITTHAPLPEYFAKLLKIMGSNF